MVVGHTIQVTSANMCKNNWGSGDVDAGEDEGAIIIMLELRMLILVVVMMMLVVTMRWRR